ncbi:Hypothetical protein, putative [Bodo saltans]|uniref:Uncharacterized protein n=1 Tax=Bodo saltans TaxID=75058 RepID=A0A0S4JCE6_BODSA|nr:Hypothetical protein, putative [Bodo saltans]|eukprot:CUG89216.1 Hypothetical protein, putative [Bodo saltans]
MLRRVASTTIGVATSVGPNILSTSSCPAASTAAVAASSGASSLSALYTQRRHVKVTPYPVPVSRKPPRRKKNSNFDFLSGKRLLHGLTGGTHADRNKVVYRNANHHDARAAKQHRLAVKEMLESQIHYLPRDVVVEAFLGFSKRKDANIKWRRSIRKTRTFHSLTKDRLVVHAFFAYLESPQWKQQLTSTFSPKEQQRLERCRSSWLLEPQFMLPVRRYLKDPKRMEKHADPFWRYAILHRNDKAVPMAWDHYKAVLPVTKAMLVERKETERAEEVLASTIPTRRFIHSARNKVLRQMFDDYVKSPAASAPPVGGHDRGRPAYLGALKRIPLLPHLQKLLREQQVVAKMFLCFFQTPEAKLFNSGVSNYIQVQRFQYMVANGGLRPPRKLMLRSYRAFKKLSPEDRRPYYGIPPRSLERPTNGFLLFLRHYHREKLARLAQEGQQQPNNNNSSSNGPPSYVRSEELKVARKVWKQLNDTQKCAFEFPFPVSIAPIRPNRLPFHRFLVEQTRILAPPLGRTGRTPLWFCTECRNRWRNLSAADKNRYDTDEEVKVLFPLVA